MGGKIFWQDTSLFGYQKGEGVAIFFSSSGRITRRDMVRFIAEAVESNKLDFIQYISNGLWRLNFDAAKKFFNNDAFSMADWAHSSIVCSPEVEITRRDFNDTESTILSFQFTKKELAMMIQQKIFLSHKGINKPFVRETAKLLTTLGFQPWLDEEAMSAGANLERSLLEGMRNSCAAIFFITPEYQDENYLATEIEYAIQEKRTKGDRFAIIAIVLSDKEGSVGTVPDLLRTYVWKQPENEIRMIDEIIRALPVRLDGIIWK